MEVNAIYEGDNLEILNKFPSGSVDLIYLDPPFFSNQYYEKIWGDKAETMSFKDRWKGGIEHYTSWMEPRLRECHRILKETGSIYLHCDWHANAHLRILMDKIFGENNFRNEIVWHYFMGGKSSNFFARKHDNIYFYVKGKRWNFNPMKHKRRLDFKPSLKDESKNADVGKDEFGYYSIVSMDDVWDIKGVFNMSNEYMGYPTQKPEALLDRIIRASSNERDIVLDPFCGCGTTLMSAQRLKRRWAGIDISPTACKLMAKRLKKEFAINPHLIRGVVDINYVKKLEPFEFQNWVVIDNFLGTASKKKSGDMGVDGFTPFVLGGYPIQVKQSEQIGRNVIDNFETAMDRINKKKGYIVAFSFGKGAYEEVARIKNEKGIHIILRTVQEILNGKTEEE